MEPKIRFNKLKGFPVLNEGEQINTLQFLEASREIVSVIENFGKFFLPVVYDMNGNIEKLNKCYLQNPKENEFLDEMIKVDAKKPNSNTTDSLLWLKRALELIEQFFTNIYNDRSYEDNLKNHLKAAYKNTLQPYHGWLVQETFSIIYRWIPTRTQLIGKDEANIQNVNDLEMFLPQFRQHLSGISSFYTENNLNHSVKA